MKFSLLVLLVFLSLNAFSQIEFESGYYINNEGERIEGLIKNVDWKKNPNDFEFKPTIEAEPQIFTIDNVQEFGITGISKYQRAKVSMDRSSDNIKHLSTDQKPQFSEETLFLNVLVEGEATLYSFEDQDIKKFFFSKSDRPIEQLIYKRYMTKDNLIAENNMFRQELWNALRCDAIEISKIENIDYKKGELTDLFVDYNECVNSEYAKYQKVKKDYFNIKVLAGGEYANFKIYKVSKKKTFDAGGLGIRFGIEGEFILPFNKNKWSINLSTIYQNIDLKEEVEDASFEIAYSSIEFSFGFKHYFFLNEVDKIFILGNAVIDFPLNTKVLIDNTDLITLGKPLSLNAGAGIVLRNKYSVGYRYNFNHRILIPYTEWISDHNSHSFYLGYRIFSK